MEILFAIVYGQLYLLAMVIGITYQEVNILVYYVLIPYSYIVLIDKIFNFHYLKIAFTLILIIPVPFLGNLHIFCRDLFDKSVIFLLSFEKINLPYVEASVFICVFGVILIYGILLWLNIYISERLKKT
jgi:hypothetical protein